MVVEVPNESQFDSKIVGEVQGSSCVEENRTRAFLLEFLVSQIRLFWHTERPKPLTWDVWATHFIYFLLVFHISFT